MDAEKKQVVCVTLGGEAEYSAQLETEDSAGARKLEHVPLDEKLVKRMGHMRRQFFFAHRRVDGSWKLGAYAPWRDW